MECQQGFERCSDIQEVPFLLVLVLDCTRFNVEVTSNTILLMKYTLPKTNGWIPKWWALEQVTPFNNGHAWHPMLVFGGVLIIVSLPPSMAGEKWVHFIWPNGIIFHQPTRWAPTSYNWSYNPYKWPYKWVTGVITPINGVITLLITGRFPWNFRGPISRNQNATILGGHRSCWRVSWIGFLSWPGSHKCRPKTKK